LDKLRFYAIGFILYFPSNDPYWTWSPGHRSILLITALFIWLFLLISIFIIIQSTIIWSILKRQHRDLNRYNILNNDDDQTIENLNNPQFESLKTNNEMVLLF